MRLEGSQIPVRVVARKRDIVAVLAGAAALLEALGVLVGQLGPLVAAVKSVL